MITSLHFHLHQLRDGQVAPYDSEGASKTKLHKAIRPYLKMPSAQAPNMVAIFCPPDEPFEHATVIDNVSGPWHASGIASNIPPSTKKNILSLMRLCGYKLSDLVELAIRS